MDGRNDLGLAGERRRGTADAARGHRGAGRHRLRPESRYGQRAAVYTSTDNGAKWSARGDPCPNITDGYETDTVAVTLAGANSAEGLDSAIVFDCATRSLTSDFVGGGTYVSVDGGASLTSTAGAGGKLDPATALAAVSAATQFVVATGSAYTGNDGPALFVSRDTGQSWSVVAGVPITGRVVFFGFESTTTGRLVTDNGQRSTVWTTTDAGQSWSQSSFG